MTWVLRDSCPGPQVTSGSVCLPCPRPSRAQAPLWRPEPSWPGAHCSVPAIPVRSGRMDTLEAVRQRLQPAGGVRRVDWAGAGSAAASSSARAAAGPGSVLAEGSPLPSPPWHRGGRSRGEEAGGGVGSVRPEGLPSAALTSGPAARAASGCPG